MSHAAPNPDDLFPANPPPYPERSDQPPRHATLTTNRTPPGGEPVLALDEITIRFRRAGQPDLAIVSDLTLHLSRGEFTCVAGRSGSGKTSILRVAAGLATPTTGTVHWRKVDITTLSPDKLADQRRGLCGILDQTAALLPELSALENVLLAAVPDRRTRELRPRAETLLDHLGLAGRIRHRPDRLSGGERQRVGLARAMLLDPPVLIVDEPTASLDRAWADTIIDTLTTASQNGTTVLAASHDPHLVTAAHTTIPLDN